LQILQQHVIQSRVEVENKTQLHVKIAQLFLFYK